MNIKKKTSCLSLSSEKYVFFLLILFSLGIGLYLILSTVLISKDGVRFIQFAQALQECPRKTLLVEYQHPGYPFLIITMQKLISAFAGTSVDSWLFSAQFTAVLFKTLTLAVLYVWGKRITDSKFKSFLGVFILACLPLPAHYGSDALSDWPALFSISFCLLCLVISSQKKQLFLYGLIGLVGGAGYLIRPEAGQVVLYACGTAIYLFISGKITVFRLCTMLFVVILCFTITTAPYMVLKKSILPKKTLVRTTDAGIDHSTDETSTPPCRYNISGFQFGSFAGGFQKLFSNFGETYMWYFTPFWIIGIINWFRQTTCRLKKLLLTGFISLNVIVVLMLYYAFGYMSDRHTLPLFAVTFMFIPIGLDKSSCWIARQYNIKNANKICLALAAFGVVICMPKLLRPLGNDKRFYKDAALWLRNNAGDDEVVAVCDPRIGFYCRKKWVLLTTTQYQKADWIADRFEKDHLPENPIPENQHLRLVREFAGKKRKICLFQNERTI